MAQTALGGIVRRWHRWIKHEDEQSVDLFRDAPAQLPAVSLVLQVGLAHLQQVGHQPASCCLASGGLGRSIARAIRPVPAAPRRTPPPRLSAQIVTRRHRPHSPAGRAGRAAGAPSTSAAPRHSRHRPHRSPRPARPAAVRPSTAGQHPLAPPAIDEAAGVRRARGPDIAVASLLAPAGLIAVAPLHWR